MARTLRREDLTFVDRAPLLIEQHVDLSTSPDRVWPALAEADAWTEWFAGMKVCRYTSPEPHGVGSTRAVRVKTLDVTEEILAFDEDRRFAFMVVESKTPGVAAMVEVVTLDEVAGGTRVTYRQAVEPAGWLRPLRGLLRRQLSAGLAAGLAGLGAWVDQHGA